ncbi:MAG: hypothetical protein U0Q07_19570 [Acidimicrobiales bacterium]
MATDRRTPIGTVSVMVAGFVMIGLGESSFGIAWPAMRETFDQPLAAIAFLLYAMTGGYLTGSLVLSRIADRVPTGGLLVVAPVAGVVGASLIALAPVLAVAVPGAFLLGLAGAGVDGRLNTYTSVHLGSHLLNFMHGGFGVGAFLGPLGVTALLAAGASWRWAYAFLAVYDVALVVAFVVLRHRWLPLPTAGEVSALGDHGDVADDELVVDLEAAERAEPDGTAGAPASATGRRSMLVLVLATAGFFTYTGVEVTCGYWAFELLTTRGLSTGAAGVVTSCYWAALMVGRFALGTVGRRVPPSTVLTLAAVGTLGGTLVIELGAVAPAAGAVGFVLTGLALSGIFPAMVAMTPFRFGPARSARVMGVQLAGASLGVATIPSLAGLVAQRSGSAALGPAMVATAVLFAAAHAGTTLVTRPTAAVGGRLRRREADV